MTLTPNLSQLYNDAVNQQMHDHKSASSYIINIQQHVLVAFATIIWVFYCNTCKTHPMGGEIFRPSRPALEPTQLPVKWVFPGGKVRTGSAADYSPPSSAEVMDEYSYTSTHPLGHNRACNGNTLPFSLVKHNRPNSVT